MRNFFLLPLVLCGAAFLLPACADQSHPSSGDPAHHHADTIDPKEIPPHMGMTRHEVFAMYGEPARKYVDDMGETWVYYLNAGEIATKSLIPFYIPPRLRTGVLTFGPNGTVVRFRWEPDSHQ